MISRSELLEEVFECKVATTAIGSLQDITDCETFCRERRIDLCVARVPSGALDVVHRMQAEEYLVMGTTLHYRKRVSAAVPLDDRPDLRLRPARSNELEFVLAQVARGFDRYSGHYHADKRLSPRQCVRLYQRYAEESWRSARDTVLIVERDGAKVGFVTLRKTTDSEFNILLLSLLPLQLGTGTTILSRIVLWVRAQGARILKTERVVTNLGPQRMLEQNGFSIVSSQYVFHRWFS